MNDMDGDGAAAPDEEILRSLKMIGEGNYGQVPEAAEGIGAHVKHLAHDIEVQQKDNLRGMVQASVECGDAMFSLAQMTRDVREVNNRAQAISTAAQEMVATVQDIAFTSDAAASDANEVEETATKGLAAAENAVITMQNITRAVEGAASKVDDLAEASARIGDIVASIEAIAKQTNLLALNATIEAARAGDAGKGFAVVAGEVKNLANQTARATDDIRTRISNLRDEMAEIVESMEQGAKAVQEGEEIIVATGNEMRSISERIGGVTGNMRDVTAILAQQREASNEVSQGINVIADMADRNSIEINKVVDSMDGASNVIGKRLAALGNLDIDHKVVDIAKADHVAFKNRIMEAAIGRCSLSDSDVPDHRGCRLGKWYYAIDEATIRNDATFRALEDPHVRVHRNGKDALRALNNGDMDMALAEIGKMALASIEVLELLDRLSKNLSE
jgi:methyl-accepting chemotaxis protein